jgi:hypothetical protein
LNNSKSKQFAIYVDGVSIYEEYGELTLPFVDDVPATEVTETYIGGYTNLPNESSLSAHFHGFIYSLSITSEY